MRACVCACVCVGGGGGGQKIENNLRSVAVALFVQVAIRVNISGNLYKQS